LNLTLLVENNPKIEAFYSLNLITWLGLELLSRKNAHSATELLKSDGARIKLIIVRSTIEREDSAKLLIDYVEKNELNIPVIVIGPGREIASSFAHVPNSLQLKVLIQGAARALNITAKDMSAKVVPDHFPIPISYFKLIKRSICPVYFQDKTDPKKYHQWSDKLIDFDERAIDILIEEGVTRLYIPKLSRLEFVNNVTSELMTLLDSGEVSPDEAMSAADKSLELLSKKLLTIGLNEETIEHSKKSLAAMRKNVTSHPKLSKLLERLLANRTSYLYKHTQILTYICLHIIKNIDWGNQEQEDKVSFIAFFHDIVLQTDEQGEIKSNLELKTSKMNIEEKLLVEKHAQLAAELVAKFPHAPMGADQIIRQHHGTLNGVGYSEHYGNNVSPVSIVFIVAEEFTRIVLKRETGPFDRPEMLQELKEEFPTSRFQKVVDLLKTITF
jgi:response regulator RpfG family c-di-GMP phosphodiesterase